MDEKVKELLRAVARGQISYAEAAARLPAGFQLTKEHVEAEVRAAMGQSDPDELDLALNLLWLYNDDAQFIDLLNLLLLVPHHWSHQVVARTLQDVASPSSIPFIRAALESTFDYLEYTASEPGVIAKWFSWALCSIGTPEAIQTIRDFTTRGRKGVRREMRYRLQQMGLEP
ncbi:hypothetical protein EJV47_06780 [Hymenobacter gummosus]|uniref:HEAT repeat domain-containing protein n=1 Tax=Hymenobacter gummosus TaxID=1776032 RepID=A0A431U585_9BACT|nr:hypothetical protein [Hymenobacter gummosus]RTQ51500.1 hypothetical protein EJV47_06780 [Hymenobacter gummosus]